MYPSIHLFIFVVFFKSFNGEPYVFYIIIWLNARHYMLNLNECQIVDGTVYRSYTINTEIKKL